ncbi:MAG: 5-formyltetrahydrofolate cyclo-ligase [Lachnospiraceae bacterium]|nr:5-formyltetrahydrofolate cyclo-ligase [Lachnospiraceae bacterium]
MDHEKKRFRTEALAARDSLTPEQRKRYSDRIIRNLIGLPCYQEADAILTYISFRSEVDTFPLLERAFADGKAVFAPKVSGKEMAFYRIFSKNDLAVGYQGIPEPIGGQLFEPRRNDQISQRILVCLPGAAFDRSCHRIGYGGGFYDRYLGDTACSQMRYVTAALSFNCQIFEEIPWETHDIRPEQIITQTEIISR